MKEIKKEIILKNINVYCSDGSILVKNVENMKSARE